MCNWSPLYFKLFASYPTVNWMISGTVGTVCRVRAKRFSLVVAELYCIFIATRHPFLFVVPNRIQLVKDGTFKIKLFEAFFWLCCAASFQFRSLHNRSAVVRLFFVATHDVQFQLRLGLIKSKGWRFCHFTLREWVVVLGSNKNPLIGMCNWSPLYFKLFASYPTVNRMLSRSIGTVCRVGAKRFSFEVTEMQCVIVASRYPFICAVPNWIQFLEGFALIIVVFQGNFWVVVSCYVSWWFWFCWHLAAHDVFLDCWRQCVHRQFKRIQNTCLLCCIPDLHPAPIFVTNGSPLLTFICIHIKIQWFILYWTIRAVDIQRTQLIRVILVFSNLDKFTKPFRIIICRPRPTLPIPKPVRMVLVDYRLQYGRQSRPRWSIS